MVRSTCHITRGLPYGHWYPVAAQMRRTARQFYGTQRLNKACLPYPSSLAIAGNNTVIRRSRNPIKPYSKPRIPCPDCYGGNRTTRFVLCCFSDQTESHARLQSVLFLPMVLTMRGLAGACAGVCAAVVATGAVGATGAMGTVVATGGWAAG